jgi:hypothetical protein
MPGRLAASPGVRHLTVEPSAHSGGVILGLCEPSLSTHARPSDLGQLQYCRNLSVLLPCMFTGYGLPSALILSCIESKEEVSFKP